MSVTTAVSAKNRILGGLWGSLVGDALGVPVEFLDRASVQADPVTEMRGFGTHRQPAGTWSDDSSLLLCTADSLVHHEFAPKTSVAALFGGIARGFGRRMEKYSMWA